jgi:hypothetical protein
MGVIEQLDGQYMKDGKSGIWADFSDQGKHAIAASAVPTVGFIQNGQSTTRPRRCIAVTAKSIFS